MEPFLACRVPDLELYGTARHLALLGQESSYYKYELSAWVSLLIIW